jgi:transposase
MGNGLFPERKQELIAYRQQAHYWKAQHTQTVEREAFWKDKAIRLEVVLQQQAKEIRELAAMVEALRAKVIWLQQQVFGKKTEQGTDESPDKEGIRGETFEPAEAGRSRGKQPGQQGHGRRRREGLPTEEVLHDLPEFMRLCSRCGRPAKVFPGTEDSEEISWEVHLIRRIHKRTRYTPTCRCNAVPGIITAPAPPKLIPKGMFSIEFWVRLLLEKFLYQRPLYRLRQMLAIEGLSVSQGTLTGGLERIGGLLQPLYVRILEHSRSAHHWHMDETGWMVFADIAGKRGHRWWLWVVVTADTCCYLLEPTRSAAVPINHLGEAEGIISVDRYTAYKTLGEQIQRSYCWVHVRRDFIRLSREYARCRSWAEDWVERINHLFHLNHRRLEARSRRQSFSTEDAALRDALDTMAGERDHLLSSTCLHAAKRKVLQSLRHHWEGLTLFVKHPDIPMDNNEAERRLRKPVIGRKNYYGSGAVWSGALAASTFTLLQTLLLNHINPQTFLMAYFDACAHNGGRPPDDIDSYLPWNLSEEQKTAWTYQERPP